MDKWHTVYQKVDPIVVYLIYYEIKYEGIRSMLKVKK